MDDPAHSVVQPLRPQMFMRPTVGTCQRGQPHLPLHPQEEAPSEVCGRARLRGVNQLRRVQYACIYFFFTVTITGVFFGILFCFHCHQYWHIFLIFNFFTLSAIGVFFGISVSNDT